MKERPILFSGEMVRAILEGRKTQTRRVIKPQPSLLLGLARVPQLGKKCPYGQPGDLLWVRETFAGDDWTGYAYRATEPDALPFGEEIEFDKWKPSIFMPRDACRLMLKITGVRVERVQDIDYDDIVAEGIEKRLDWVSLDMKEAFINLWNHINAKRGYGWDVNPWVWVVEFQKTAL